MVVVGILLFLTVPVGQSSQSVECTIVENYFGFEVVVFERQNSGASLG